MPPIKKIKITAATPDNNFLGENTSQGSHKLPVPKCHKIIPHNPKSKRPAAAKCIHFFRPIHQPTKIIDPSRIQEDAQDDKNPVDNGDPFHHFWSDEEHLRNPENQTEHLIGNPQAQNTTHQLLNLTARRLQSLKLEETDDNRKRKQVTYI